ncbi:condensation domain-containing protein [Pseudonocardia sp. TRM90224]|uniref:condensation domain-containing protein n=1 Tax=Pseudonocardia sp. TRM90224 TaxID=2812678 RepID=UPI001E338C34|nr:condensation domain-containing protein [Pseudonocardia sp. TRM90224]
MLLPSLVEPVPLTAVTTAAPLTAQQRRIFALHRSGAAGTSVLCRTARRLRGPLDRVALDAALVALVGRHVALRTAVRQTDDGPVQLVLAAPTASPLEFVDLSEHVRPLDAARRLVDAFAEQPLPFGPAPLHRVGLVRIGADDHVLVWSLHRMVCDEHSLALLEEELLALYGRGRLEPVPVQFPEYVRWDTRRDRSPGTHYWAERLAGAPTESTLPADTARKPGAPARAGRATLQLDAELSAALLGVARRQRCSPSVLFAAAMTAALARHTGEPDVVIGMPTSDRCLPGLDRSVGPYETVLPIRADLTGATWRELLAQLRATTLSALANNALPVGGRPPFRTALVLRRPAPTEPVAGLLREPWPLPAPTGPLDLTLQVTVAERTELTCEYSGDRYTRAAIERFLDHVARMLVAMTTDLDRNPAAVPLPDGHRPPPVGASPARVATPVLERFHEIVADQPDAPAIITPRETLTYGDLDRMAAFVAEQVRGAGLVGVAQTAGFDAVAGLLGAFTAGAAALPLDPDEPHRHAALLRGNGADAVLGNKAMGRAAAPARPAAVPAGLALVFGASGLTMDHSALARLTTSLRATPGFGAGERVLLLRPLSTEAGIAAMLSALTSGAALVLHPGAAAFDARRLVRFCGRLGVTAVDAPLGSWEAWTAALTAGDFRVPHDWPVTTMTVNGGRVALPTLRAWAAATRQRVTFVHRRGPAEAAGCATVMCTVAGGRHGGSHLPVGRPLPHVEAHLLDPAGVPVPPGAVGELHLGGLGVGLGTGRYLVRTGERARRHADGTLELVDEPAGDGAAPSAVAPLATHVTPTAMTTPSRYTGVLASARRIWQPAQAC